MDLKILKKLIKEGESETLEFKSTTGQRTEGMKSVCAMLNGLGGFVIFGVTDKGELRGQQGTAKTLTEIANEMALIEPPAFPDIERIALDNSHAVIVLRVSAANGRPYTYDGRPYQRSGATTRMMPRESYEKILLERLHANHRWENQVVDSRVSMDDLDAEEIQSTVDNALRLGRLESLKNRDLVSVLRGLGLIYQDQMLNAAIVLYAKNPELQTIYPQCELRLARFRGMSRLADFSDHRQYWGNAFYLLKRAETFLRDHVPIAGKLVPGKMIREDRPLYAPSATREALANAFCHRDYTSGTISLGMYDDRLEIINPGCLHFGLTPEKLCLPHESHPWNPLIATVFYRAGIIEKWGSGTMKIIDWCQEIDSPRPQWIERENDTLVIFSPAEKFEASQQASTGQVTRQVTGQVVEDILRFCQVPRKAAEIQKLLKLKHREIFQNNYLKPLIAQKLLALTMPNKPKSRLQQYVITEDGKKITN